MGSTVTIRTIGLGVGWRSSRRISSDIGSVVVGVALVLALNVGIATSSVVVVLYCRLLTVRQRRAAVGTAEDGVIAAWRRSSVVGVIVVVVV